MFDLEKDKATHFKNKRWFVKLFQDIPMFIIWWYRFWLEVCYKNNRFDR